MIGMGLAQELAANRLAEQIPRKLSGLRIARTSKDNMMLILDGIMGILFQVKAIKLSSWKAWI